MENIHLGDRDGVRAPMQWSPDRNGGFSRADPAALVLPMIRTRFTAMAPSMEAQGRDPHSLLNWMRRMLAVRGRHPAFGRGKLTLLSPKNRKVLAYLRQYRDDTLLCVANVAHSPQAVELDLSQFAGRVPVELNAGSVFPPIGELTYLLTLPPYGYWFALATEAISRLGIPQPRAATEFATMVIRDSLAKARRLRPSSFIEDEALRNASPNGDGSVSRIK
jgi:maltose alpha-D-glucosyltransferase/alpha-amylase